VIVTATQPAAVFGSSGRHGGEPMTYRAEEVATLGVSKKHCYACANILDARAELCPKCGVRQPHLAGAMVTTTPAPIIVTAPPPTTTKNKTTAGLLALFFGGIGVHKFYLGQGGSGVIYLLFCWTLIPALVAFIEALVLFGMNDAAFATKYPG
jgi:TM2 domain-containing membrane protein YozV